MISREELNPHGYELTPEQARNFEFLFVAINAVRCAYGKPMIVTSGVRSIADQQRINPRQMDDAHTKAAACDVLDVDKSLLLWCMANLGLLGRLGLYLEDRRYTPNWVHFQIYPPKSGKRIFVP